MGKAKLKFGRRDLVQTTDGDFGEITGRDQISPRRYQYDVKINAKGDFPPMTFKANELKLVCPGGERHDLTEHQKKSLDW